MTKKGIVSAICVAGIVACLAMAVNGMYQDKKAREKHDMMEKDLTKLTNTVFRTVQAESRVIDLPDDSGKWYLTVYDVNDNSYVDNWFVTNKRLITLRGLVKFFRFHPTDPIYVNRVSKWPRWGGNTSPHVVLEDPTGCVVYEAAGSQLPRDSETLANDIATMVSRYRTVTASSGVWPPEDCPDCRPFRPRPTPAPAPVPTPAPQPVTPSPPPYVGPDSGPPAPAPSEDTGISNWALLGICVVAGFVVGMVNHAKKVTHFG